MSAPQESGGRLPPQFRKWDTAKRREAIELLALAGGLSKDEVRRGFGSDPDMIDLADAMIESAIGYASMPIGMCRGFVVDGQAVDVPLVTEEPSVVAAANYAAGMIARAGGITTRCEDPITTGQIFIEDARPDAAERILAAEADLKDAVWSTIRRMEERGGGYRGIDAVTLPLTGLLRVQIHLDVRDAMGANLVNSAVEAARPTIESITGGRCLMAILSNSADRRVATAGFRLPIAGMARAGSPGEEVARRIVLASDLAQEDPSRAVTHNKGIMNGITSLLLATGNDTRAVEAAVHRYAARTGHYRGLATYRIEGQHLVGSLEVPLAVGTVGGAAGIHPTSRLCLALLGSPSSGELARIAVAVGLNQNFAALSALVTDGIQRGHMALHARRLAWKAGARGEERAEVARTLTELGTFNDDTARIALDEVRRVNGTGQGESTR